MDVSVWNKTWLIDWLIIDFKRNMACYISPWFDLKRSSLRFLNRSPYQEQQATTIFFQFLAAGWCPTVKRMVGIQRYTREICGCVCKTCNHTVLQRSLLTNLSVCWMTHKKPPVVTRTAVTDCGLTVISAQSQVLNSWQPRKNMYEEPIGWQLTSLWPIAKPIYWNGFAVGKETKLSMGLCRWVQSTPRWVGMGLESSLCADHWHTVVLCRGNFECGIQETSDA